MNDGDDVRALTDELAEHVDRARVAEAEQVADALLELDDEALVVGDPAIARMLLRAGSALIPTDPDRAERLYLKGIDAIALSPNTTDVELVVPLNNLMAIYDQTGNVPACNHVAATIGGLAERLDGPLSNDAAAAFLQLGESYEARGNAAAAMVFFQQVDRYMTARADVAPDVLASWSRRHALRLNAAGERKPAEAVLELAAAAAEARLAASPDPAAVKQAGTVFAQLGLLRLGDGRAAEAVAPLRRAAELAQNETGPRRAGAVSDLATAYFESGDLESASREYTRAIDLRLSQA